MIETACFFVCAGVRVGSTSRFRALLHTHSDRRAGRGARACTACVCYASDIASDWFHYIALRAWPIDHPNHALTRTPTDQHRIEGRLTNLVFILFLRARSGDRQSKLQRFRGEDRCRERGRRSKHSLRIVYPSTTFIACSQLFCITSQVRKKGPHPFEFKSSDRP